MSNPDYKAPSVGHYRSDSEFSGTITEHQRRESNLSAPVSDYEYFAFSPSSNNPPPPTPQTPIAPPRYKGTDEPVSPPSGDHLSNSGVIPLGSERNTDHASYPEVVSAEENHLRNGTIPEYQMTPDHGEKEAYYAPKVSHQTKFEEQPTTPRSDPREDPIPTSTEDKSRRYLFGLTKRGFIILIAAIIIVIIAIAVGVGVGVGVSSSHGSSSSKSEGKNPLYSMGGALNPAYYSTQGAFNGSGIALADVNFGLDNSLYVFYQTYQGTIEQLIYRADGTWSFVTQVATDAKNSTPLSTVAYIVESVATWHLFYISNDNILKQRISSNASDFQTNIWSDGPLTELALSVNDADSVGMQACYFGNYYGSLVNYNDAAFGASNATATTGMNIWYGVDNSTFQQYDWTHGQAQWTKSRTWNNMNTHAGVGCQSWLTNTTSYVFFVDDTDTLGIWWRDIDTNKSSTDSHPINQYTQAPLINITNIHPSSSLGYTDFMIYQTVDDLIHGVNITWAAEDTAIAPAKESTSSAEESNSDSQDQWALEPKDTGLGGTHMAITGSQPISGGRQELLFYQSEGNDLKLGKRDAAGGDFAFISVNLENLAQT